MIDFKSRYLLAKNYDTPQVDRIYTISSNPAILNTPEGMNYFLSLFIPAKNVQADKILKVRSYFGNNEVTLYVFYPDNKPDGKLPAVYWIHGGGYILGETEKYGLLNKEMANANNVIVVSVDYRIAIQAPFPADINDCVSGLRYIFTNGKELDIDTDKIIISGPSAGGGLAARLALYNRDHDKFPLKGQVLIYPMLDYRTGTPEAPIPNPFGGQLVWTPELNQQGWTVLKGGQDIPEDQMPYYSAATAKTLAGLPSTFILVGNMDLFSVEDFTYGQRLIVDGVPTEFHQLYGLYHGFDLVEPDSPQTKLMNDLQNKAIQRMISE
ncbi:MAG: alpha/beta hydrolase [Bacteroides sp.]|nr:alpha/beta hydrolase [Bacteroides sp.]